MNVRWKSTAPLTALAMTALLTSGCATTAPSAATETERALCHELRMALPSWSVEDTAQSREEGADFLDVFEVLCGPVSGTGL